MNTLLKLIIISVILNLFTPVYAQPVKFVHLSHQDGLSQATVYNILQDHKGFMWFGTQDGLNKYDGYKFTYYRHDPQNPASLGNSFILAIYEDKTGTLWIGTDGGGLDKYDRQHDKFEHYQNDPQNPNSLSNDIVLSIYEDLTGLLWISTGEGGLNSYDRHQDKFTHYRHDPHNPTSLSSDALWRIFEDSTGTLWIGADGAGLNKFDRAQNKFERYQHNPNDLASLSYNKVTAIYEDSTGVLWVGTEDGLNKFDRQHNNFTHYFHEPKNSNSLSHSTIWAICEDSTGMLWVGTDGGLNQFNREQNKFSHYLHDPQDPNSLSNDYVMAIYEDKAGALWIGTDGGGLNKFDRHGTKFAHYFHNPQKPASLSNNLVSSIFEDMTGMLWVGTSYGLNQFSRDRQQVIHYLHDPLNPASISHDDIWSIYEDRAQTLWVGTLGGGLNKFDRQQNQFTQYKSALNNPNSLSDNKVRVIHQGKADSLWVGTREGLNKFDPKSEQFIQYRSDPNNPNSLSNDNILSIYEDRTGILWIGTQGGGLNRFNWKQNQFKHYLHDPQNSKSLSHNEVFTIHEDTKGVLWVGTAGGGLNQFKHETETFIHYREKDGLANDVIYGILEDKQGNLWLSTNGGISKFNPITKQFRNYDVLDGLQGDEFRAAYHHSRTGGELFFGGINGFNAFNPQLVKDNSYIPPIVITDFKIFNKPVPIGADSPLQQQINEANAITLSYKQSFFSFEFAALNFLLPQKNQYKYILEGLDNNWNEVYTRRSAYYTKVPPGKYVFRVKGSNNDAVWNDTGTALKITIPPPPWQTWWAYTLYIITILAIVLNYQQTQKRKLLAKQRELEREQQIAAQLKEANRLKDEFLANTSHELRTPLNGIIGIAESLIDGVAGQMTDKLNSNLAMIVSSGRRLNSLINDILDFSQLKKKEIDLQLKSINMYEIADIVLTLTKPLIKQKNILFVNAIHPELPPINADENRIQQILYNLVGNAIKFTDSGMVEISGEIINESEGNPFLAITVSDTGIGIPEEKIDRIFEAFEQAEGSTARVYGGTGLGLAVTQQLVNLHGGQMLVLSKVGVGSNFTFTLPISYKGAVQPSVTIVQSASHNYKLSKQLEISEPDQPETIAIPEISEPDQPKTTDNEPLPVTGEYTILIVDDEPVNRQVLVNHLSMQNYRLLQAELGAEALDIVEKEPPDIILLDVMMPYMTGYEVTKKIRQTHKVDELPIILLTAKNQMADLVTGFESGANDYLTKPVSKDELLARIKTHIHILQLKAETLQLAIENKNRLTQFLESMPIGVGVVSTNGDFFYHNQKAKEILNKDTEIQAIDQVAEFYQLHIAGSTELYPVDKLPLMQALNGKNSAADNLEIHRDDDTIISLEIWGTPIFDSNGEIIYAINVFQDITERKTVMESQEKFTEELFLHKQAYERFVPREFLNLLDKQSVVDVKLGDHIEREITVLFADIRKFTAISETMTPQENFNFINSYLGQMEPIIRQHKGFIDKFIGDAIMALFPTGADDAVCGAIGMLKKLATYNEGRQKAGYISIKIGIGLNTGPLMLGTVGGKNRMDGTVIADAVNLASRVEGLTKIYNASVLITEQTYLELVDPLQYNIRVVDAVKVKGKSEVITIYEVFDADPPEILALKNQTSDSFEEGFVLYHWDEYQDAQKLFEKVLKINAKDKAAQVYLERCQEKLIVTIPKSPTILIVEDTDINARILSSFLAKNNYKVSIAKSGEEALQQIQFYIPHLILLDIVMPGIDGFETCRRFKANPQSKDIPIIFMTSLAETVDKVRGLELGAVDYITKPFQFEEVLARINNHLKLSSLKYQLQFQKSELENKNLELTEKMENLDKD